VSDSRASRLKVASHLASIEKLVEMSLIQSSELIEF
jgi:hypothetical protein